jgi:hypothetical protein
MGWDGMVVARWYNRKIVMDIFLYPPTISYIYF